MKSEEWQAKVFVNLLKAIGAVLDFSYSVLEPLLDDIYRVIDSQEISEDYLVFGFVEWEIVRIDLGVHSRVPRAYLWVYFEVV